MEAAHYGETRQRLMRDPIVAKMASEIEAFDPKLERFLHEDGTPRFEFMQRANREYRDRGGKDGGHIGAVAEAIRDLINGPKMDRIEDATGQGRR